MGSSFIKTRWNIFEQPEIQYSYPVKPRLKEDKTIEQSFQNYKPIKETIVEEKRIYEEKKIPEIKIQEEPISYPLPKVEETNDKGPEFFKHLQVLAQLHDSYILCSNEEGLVIVHKKDIIMNNWMRNYWFNVQINNH